MMSIHLYYEIAVKRSHNNTLKHNPFCQFQQNKDKNFAPCSTPSFTSSEILCRQNVHNLEVSVCTHSVFQILVLTSLKKLQELYTYPAKKKSSQRRTYTDETLTARIHTLVYRPSNSFIKKQHHVSILVPVPTWNHELSLASHLTAMYTTRIYKNLLFPSPSLSLSLFARWFASKFFLQSKNWQWLEKRKRKNIRIPQTSTQHNLPEVPTNQPPTGAKQKWICSLATTTKRI